jgi:hypothetical protein
MERNIFGLSHQFTVLIFIITGILIITTIQRQCTRRPIHSHYQIKTAKGEYFMTEEYTVNGDCVTFEDDLGQEQTICGNPKITPF